MNINVITENKYLFQGILHSLTNFSNFTVTLSPSGDKERLEIIKGATNTDLLLLVADPGYKYDVHFLIAASKCQAAVIYAGSFENFHFQHMFGFTIIGAHFYLSDLLQALYISNTTNRTIRFPKITLREKKILFHTWKGKSVAEMAGFLNVEPKTVYHHQRNVLKKIGVRKPRDLYLLPENLIEHMYLAYAD